MILILRLRNGKKLKRHPFVYHKGIILKKRAKSKLCLKKKKWSSQFTQYTHLIKNGSANNACGIIMKLYQEPLLIII